MELNEQQRVRLEKVRSMRDEGIEPYPPRAERTHSSTDAVSRFESLEDSLPDGRDTEAISVVGRVVGFRDMGKSTFVHIEDGHGRLQLYLRANVVGPEAYEAATHRIDLGDFVQASGHLFRTRTGEVTVEVAEWSMLSKAITPI